MNTHNKIVIIGAGMVGTAFLYSAIHKNLASEYVIIDINHELATGHILDIEDALGYSDQHVKITLGDYNDCQNADVVVVTAGRPQREGETRLDMTQDNAKIMTSIATSIQKSGFDGISIIASNPVDILTTVYQKVTGFHHNRVISSGCVLDSSRLKVELSHRYGISPSNIDGYVLGEHGDSSVIHYSGIEFDGMAKIFTQQEQKELHDTVFQKAYKIISAKGSTYYGIGGILSSIVSSIVYDEKKVFPIGYYSDENRVYSSFPHVIGKEGIEKKCSLTLDDDEEKKLTYSINLLRKGYDDLGM